jgi:hypothetical protein
MPDGLYDTDLLAWSREQAGRLRRVAAGERINDLDWANVIEEIEGLGASELRAVQSLITVAVLHGLKIIAWPDHPAAEHWMGELATFVAQAKVRLQPGMVQRLPAGDILDRTLRDFRKLVTTFPVAPGPVPTEARFTTADFLDPDFGARDLLDRLRAGIAAPA